MEDKRLRKKRDQELIEILNEVRVALSGASVLFGFLLVVPFSSGWRDSTTGQQVAYGLAFVATLLAVVGFMTPTAYHRLRWRDRNKERMLRVSHAGALSGIAFLAVAMIAGTYFVMSELVGTVWVVVLTVFAALAFLVVWFAVPLSTPYERWDEEYDVDELEEHGEEPPHGSGVG